MASNRLALVALARLTYALKTAELRCKDPEVTVILQTVRAEADRLRELL